MLRQTGQVGEPREHFHKEFLLQTGKATGHPRLTRVGRARRVARRIARSPDWLFSDDYSVDEVREHVAAMIRTHTGSSGVYSLKTHWNQYRNFILDSGLDQEVFGSPVTFVWLRRQDRVAQACSQVRAQQTGLWQAGRTRIGAGGEPRYDADAIAHCLGWLGEGDDAWRSYFALRGIEPLVLTYEQWTPKPENAVDEILGRLGLSRAKTVTVDIQKMSDGVSAEWTRRFRSEFPEIAR